MPKYHMKAETGKLGMASKKDVPMVKIDGQEIVAGVVVIHNMLMALARQLAKSQDVLMQLAANPVEMDVDIQELDRLVEANAELLGQINVK